VGEIRLVSSSIADHHSIRTVCCLDVISNEQDACSVSSVCLAKTFFTARDSSKWCAVPSGGK
jgi:hypothetical protein